MEERKRERERKGGREGGRGREGDGDGEWGRKIVVKERRERQPLLW